MEKSRRLFKNFRVVSDAGTIFLLPWGDGMVISVGGAWCGGKKDSGRTGGAPARKWVEYRF